MEGTNAKTILLVDDDASILKYMSLALKQANYNVLTAERGSEGIELLKRVQPDLIILDMNMPGMNGLEFLKYIRGENLTSVPVLILSGTSDLDLIMESYHYGVYDFIKKPEHTGVMLKRVENGLKIGEMIAFNEYIKIELSMAKNLQKNLFPGNGVSGKGYNLVAWNKPLTDIGGDLYDFIPFRDGRLIFFVADVSGHSISAALYTTILKMIFRNAMKVTGDPGEIMSIINQELSENLSEGSFVTMFLGLYDPTEHILHYVNGGHPAPLLLHDGSMTLLKEASSFLGPILSATFTTQSITVPSTGRLVVYTDGIQDVVNHKQSADGREYLFSVFDTEPDLIKAVEKVQDDMVNRFTAHIDDSTLLVVDFD